MPIEAWCQEEHSNDFNHVTFDFCWETSKTWNWLLESCSWSSLQNDLLSVSKATLKDWCGPGLGTGLAFRNTSDMLKRLCFILFNPIYLVHLLLFFQYTCHGFYSTTVTSFMSVKCHCSSWQNWVGCCLVFALLSLWFTISFKVNKE